MRDPSVFSTESNPEGIGVGTAVSLLVRKKDHSGKAQVFFRDLWGTQKRAQLAVDSVSGGGSYSQLQPRTEVRLPFAPAQVSSDYLTWPKLPELFTLSSPGINTSRDPGLIDTDLERLRTRIAAYFDPNKTDDQIQEIAPSLFISSNRFDPSATRAQLLSLGMQKGHFVPYAYRPFDIRWAFWYPQTKLLDEKRVELFKAFQNKALFLTSRSQAERADEGSPFYATRGLPDRHLTRPGSNCFPTRHEVEDNSPGHLFDTQAEHHGNFSMSAIELCRDLGFADLQGEQHLWNHILAIGHSPLYLRENADGIELDWPRIPLPTSPDSFAASSRIGERVLGLLLVEDDVDGITRGRIRPELSEIAVLESVDGAPLDPDAGDLSIDVGWGHVHPGQTVMPGQGKIETRGFTERERKSSSDKAGREILGDHTMDVYLNERAVFRNIPGPVWEYALGGYQVLRKWLSYREKKALGRPLSAAEAMLFASIARRIAALLLLGPEMDQNYSATTSR